MSLSRVLLRLVCLPAFCCLAFLVPDRALAFDYASYPETNLDKVLDTPRPETYMRKIQPDISANATITAFDIPATPIKMRFRVVLVSGPSDCDLFNLTHALTAVNAKDWLDKIAVRQCVDVKSASGREARFFVQGALTKLIRKEVLPNAAMEVFAAHVYTTNTDGPGILVNAFRAVP